MRVDLIKNTFFSEPEVKRELLDFVTAAKKLSFGEECHKAEEQFARYLGRKHCLLFNSGSSANLALVQAYLNLGLLKPGDAVGFSSLTWSTNVMPLIQLGLRPVPIDVELDTLNVSCAQLERVNEREKIQAFFSTNVLGFCADLDRIQSYCEKEKILYFEDNCESLGSVYKGKLVGNFGHSATYSFYVGHHLSTIEGGCVAIDDEDLYRMLVLVRSHGWDRNLSVNDQQNIRKSYGIDSTFYGKYTFYDLGYNLRPTEITGFLLQKNIEYADKIISLREKNFLKLHGSISKLVGEKLYPLRFDHMDKVSNFSFPVVCRDTSYLLDLVKRSEVLGVEIRPMIAGNIMLQPFFKKYIQTVYKESDYPNVNIIHRQGFYFGNNPDLTEEELEHCIGIFKNV